MSNENNTPETDDEQTHLNLADLRELLADDPENDATRAHFAQVLFRTLCRGQASKKPEKRLERIEELTALHRGHPGDETVRGALTMGLYNAFVDSHAAGDEAAREDYFVRMRKLHAGHPTETVVRRHFAMVLLNSATYAAEQDALDRWRGIADELRDVNRALPGDPEVSWCLGNVLAAGAAAAEERGDEEQRLSLLRELRELVDSEQANPES